MNVAMVILICIKFINEAFLTTENSNNGATLAGSAVCRLGLEFSGVRSSPAIGYFSPSPVRSPVYLGASSILNEEIQGLNNY